MAKFHYILCSTHITIYPCSRIGTMAILLLDNDDTLMVTSAVSGDFTLLNVERPLYIGGIPSSVILPQSANDVSGM